MSLSAVLMMMIPPPAPPRPWQPERAPEFTAMCHATDVEGHHWSGALTVAGQNDSRITTLELRDKRNQSISHRGRSVLVAVHPVTDGTYSFSEDLAQKNNSQPSSVEIAGLGAAPTTMVLTIRGPAKSPAFAEPAMVGLCATKSVQPGSPFVAKPEDEENAK